MIAQLVEPLVQRRILLGKDLVVLYEAVQEFQVAQLDDGTLIGCGALHALWEDLGEVRTLAVHDDWRHHGVGHTLLEQIESDALELGLSRLFCLTFETEFFGRHGYAADRGGDRRARGLRRVGALARRGHRRVPGPRAREAQHPRQHQDAEAAGMSATVSIGLPGITPHDIVQALSPRIERLGFQALWLNDNPGGDSLEGFASPPRSRRHSRSVPVSSRSTADRRAAWTSADSPSTGSRSASARVAWTAALARVLDALDELSESTTARVVVGALGPRMRRLAAEQADGVLLNWLTPSTAADAMADLHRDAHEREVTGSLYVRTIADPGARAALETEAARYESSPTYAANFERLGIRPIDATISSPEELEAYRAAVDEVVLRAITPDGTLTQLEAFVDTTAGWLRA